MKRKMMKNSYIAILVMIFFIMSCADKNTINMRISDINGLKEKGLVLCKGKEVGKVAKISFVNGRYLNVLLELNEGFYIPIGSKVSLISTDIMGTRAVSIELIDNGKYYNSFDTLLCTDKSATKLDTTLMKINSVIEEIKDSLPKLIKEKQNK